MMTPCKSWATALVGVFFLLVGDTIAVAERWNQCDSLEESQQLTAPQKQCFVFFYARGCSHCDNAKEYIDKELKIITEDVAFHYREYDVYASSDYARHLILGYEHFGWDGLREVPTVFIGNECHMSILVGDTVVIDQLLPRILELQRNPTDCYNFTALLESHQTNVGDDEMALSTSTGNNLHWNVPTLAGIKVCGIAVLLILLGAW